MAFNFPDGASNGDTHTASNGTVYIYNGTSWLVDSVTTTTNFDTKYLNTNGDGILSGSVTEKLPTGVISGSSQITITESQISDLDHYTDSDWDTRLATKSTDNLSEGSTNKYASTANG